MYKIVADKPFCSTLRFLNLIIVFPINMEQSHFRRFFIKFAIIRIVCFIICCILPIFHMVTSIKECGHLWQSFLNSRSHNLDRDILDRFKQRLRDIDIGRKGTSFYSLWYSNLIVDGIIVGISEDISVVAGTTGALTTSYLFIFQTIKWSQFFYDVTDFKKFGKHTSFDHVKNRMNIFSRIFCWYVSVGTLAYGLVAYTETSHCKEINTLGNKLHEVCGAFLQTRLPFDGNVLWIKLPLFLIQMVSLFLSVAPGALLCFMAFEATEILITHVCLLKEYLVVVFDTKNVQERSDRLRFCINYHNHILRLSDKLRYLVKFTSGHMSLISAIVFACLGNQILKIKPLGALIFLVGYVVSLFLLCHAGQRIIDETSSIDVAVYNSKWYEVDAKMMRDVSLVLFRSQKPSTLEGLPFGGVNYPLFVMIIKTSYSYLTLLNQST